MAIEKDTQGKKKKVPKLVPLTTIQPGQHFGFRDNSLEELLNNDKDSPGLWMRVKTNGEKTGRVTIVNVKTGEGAERDDTHLVIRYPVRLLVGDPEMTETE